MAAILNPEISRNDLMTMASVAGRVAYKQAHGEVEPDGSVVLPAAEIADDYRPAPAKGDRVSPVNPVTGTKPRMARERVGGYMGTAVERGLLQAKPLLTERQHANGTKYKTTDWVIGPVASFAELIAPWARYRQDQPKLRKARTIPEACPHCGKVHPRLQRTYCMNPECGAQIGPDKVIEPPVPAVITSVSDNLSEAEAHTAPAATYVRKVRQLIGGGPLPAPVEPAWLQDAPDPASDDLSEPDMSLPDDYGLDAPLLFETQEVLNAATFAPPDTTKRALQDVEAQLSRVAMQRGRTPVPKPRREPSTPAGVAGDDVWTWS